MNKVILIGHMAADPELKHTQSGIAVCSFRIGVQRRRANAQGVKEADFFTVTAWRGTAEIVVKYMRKGGKICVFGSLQTRSYTDPEGEIRYVTEVVADEVELLGNKAESARVEVPQQGHCDEQPNRPQQESMNFVQVDDEGLPF